jgi:hypothetical protein
MLKGAVGAGQTGPLHAVRPVGSSLFRLIKGIVP